MREIETQRVERLGEVFEPRIALGAYRPGDCAPAAPEANRSTVSDVEVSPSTVMQLKLSAALAASSFCSRRDGRFASVKRNTSIVAMSGAIMPEPLAMPLIVTRGPPELRCDCGGLGEGVGRHDRPRRLGPAHRAQRATRPGSALMSGRWIERFADHAGRGLEDLGRRWRRRALPRRSATAIDGLHAGLAGEGIGIAGIDDERPRLALTSEHLTHQSTGAERDFEVVKTPATDVPGANSTSRKSGRFL